MSIDESVMMRRIYKLASSDTVGEMFLMSVFLYLRICQEYCFSFSDFHLFLFVYLIP